MRTVKLPFHELSEFDRFRAFTSEMERQKQREGFETLRESNDFTVDEEPDPLESYFDNPTPAENDHTIFDSLVLDNSGNPITYNGEPISAINGISEEEDPDSNPNPAKQIEAPSASLNASDSEENVISQHS